MDSSSLTRTQTIGRRLNKPERYQPTVPLLTGKIQENKSCWVIFSRIVTFWAHPALLSSIGGLQDKQSRQAWREKIALCFIALAMSGIVAFVTIYLTSSLCPISDAKFLKFNQTSGDLGILGWQFDVTEARTPPELPVIEILKNGSGQDITNYFTRKNKHIESCVEASNSNLNFKIVHHEPCDYQEFCALNDTINDNHLLRLNLINSTRKVGYDWDQLQHINNYMVIDGNVLNLEPYMKTFPNKIENDLIDQTIRRVLNSGGKDATRYFYSKEDMKKAMRCVIDKYFAGNIDKDTIGCFISKLFLYVSLVVILGILLARFLMACVFNWFISPRLAYQPDNASNKVHPRVLGNLNMTMDKVGNDLFTVLLVTCYSESEAGIRTTCESMAATDYPNNRKLLFLVCDGIITGSGNSKSTPQICVEMMDLSPEFNHPQPMSYIAVDDGAKQYNRAKVYVGHFCHNNERVPMITVVKCGNPDEEGSQKPGNRGKRDSQLILMNFFNRVTYNDRIPSLDYDLFRKITHIMGVTPDYFEAVLMIIGLCGETRIANKRESWVTCIQVFEYYISHHLGKGFESVFGGVTCLPGCFCMYRLKSRKGKDWVPILTKPEIVQEYSQNIVNTLHQKNLLLLGEDRFLSTLMLRNFPRRKMIFCPQAICKTVVPCDFRVLLSQRRRWINSTLHNLMELVLVRNLCGTFCFSMQFVIFMELMGTVVLPIAILLTYSLLISYVITPPKTFDESIPLLMLGAVLGLPAILILITTRKLVYVLWMNIYLIFLPVWNFILPIYAYWHFDDFSWGETRKVEGESKDDNHGTRDGQFDSSKVPLKRWEEWERERLMGQRSREFQENRDVYFTNVLNPNIYYNQYI
ncbi:16002_t:CDS:2 [Funneliformis geosporum]|uniref:chitin synthase n=1 Tax=Funneliformis geosporum TaxID=1117311 RepID=A0A9W4SM96_9GLOM|nr:1632_t:CDS:2 [Funneliformis geosporum]CAI2177043.1 16002_t:CDS:2 [Funneliformis geosporum]